MPSNNEIRKTANQVVDGLTAMLTEQDLSPKEAEMFIKEVIKELKAYIKPF
jgi:hypothetical protein